jgi:hypothetical protein
VACYSTFAVRADPALTPVPEGQPEH